MKVQNIQSHGARARTWLSIVGLAIAQLVGCSDDDGSAGTPTGPDRPTMVTAQGTSGTSVAVQWVDASDDETGFAVERGFSDAGPFTEVGTTAADAERYVDNALSPQTIYWYRVRAFNDNGRSDPTTPVEAMTFEAAVDPPAAPENLMAMPSSIAEVRLTWTDASFNEERFEIERGDVRGGPFTIVGDAPADATEFVDGGLSASTTYFYRVRAVNAAGPSAFAGPISVTTEDPSISPPSAPVNLGAQGLSTTEIRVTWTDTAADESGFDVERAATAEGPFTRVQQLPADTETWTDSGLQPSTEYFYRVRATNGGGASDYVGPVGAMTEAPAPVPPTAPSNLTAQPVSPSEVRLRWADTSDSETGFEVERAIAAAGPFNAVQQLPADTETWTDAGLQASTTYYYRVRATNGAGVSPFAGPESATTETPPPPSAPTTLTAQALSSTEVRLTWVDTASNEAGFEVERATRAAGPFALARQLGANTQTWTDSGLQPSTTYYYRVRATNGSGPSNFAGPVFAETQPPPITIPNPPTLLQANAVSSSEIRISWTDRSSDEQGFIVAESRSRNGPFTEVHRTGANSSGWTRTGLMASTTYWYEVRAFNSAGASASPSPASATTRAPAICTPQQTRCVSGQIAQVETCSADGTRWQRSGCPNWTLCSRSQCRQVCGMNQSPAARTVCVVPNNDGVNNGLWLTWTDPLMAFGTYTRAGAFSDPTTPATISRDSSQTWPYYWTVTTQAGAGIEFKLNQFSGIRSPVFEARTRRSGIINRGSNRFSAAAFNGAGTVIASGAFGTVPFSWGPASFNVVAPANANFSYNGQFNSMFLSIVGDGFGSPPDLLHVNWMKLTVP